MSKTFKLDSRRRADGCLEIDAEDATKYALSIVGNSIERAGAPRFFVLCDKAGFNCRSLPDLRNVLQAISPGSLCRVYRNAMKGVTFNFDEPHAPTV